MKLYEITEGINELADLDIPEDCLADTLEALNLEFDEKALNIGKLIKNITGDIDAIKTEADRLASRKKALSNRVASLKDYLRGNMESLDKKKIADSIITVGRQQGRESIVIDDMEALPLSCIVLSKSADKTAVKECLKAGEVDGAHFERGQDIITIR